MQREVMAFEVLAARPSGRSAAHRHTKRLSRCDIIVCVTTGVRTRQAKLAQGLGAFPNCPLFDNGSDGSTALGTKRNHTHVAAGQG